MKEPGRARLRGMAKTRAAAARSVGAMNAIRPGIAGTAVVLMVTACCIVAAADERYVRSLAPIYSTTGTKIGEIMPGTGVAPAKAGTSRATITIDGWSIQGADPVIYSAVGERIILATLDASDASALAHRKTLGHKSDPYGTRWNHVQISVAVDTSQLTPRVASVWSAAHSLYAARCSACHALHSPTEFTANQWPNILTIMTKNAALDPSQAALVRQYLQTHARAQ